MMRDLEAYKSDLRILSRRPALAKKRSSILAGLMLGSALSGCATAPVSETKAFSAAVDSVATASYSLLEELSVAERSLGRNRARRRAEVSGQTINVAGVSVISGFSLKDAGYFATLGDPPTAAVFRRAFGVIQEYSTLLLALAEGQNVPAVQGQIIRLIDNLTQLGTIAGLVTPAAAASMPAIVDGIKAPLSRALAAYSASEARRLVIESALEVRALIESLREAAPAMLRTLTAPPIRAVVQGGVGRDSQIARVDFYLTQVANYVVLLDQLRAAFDAMVVAYQRPSNAATLANLADQTASLAADARAFQKAFAHRR